MTGILIARLLAGQRVQIYELFPSLRGSGQPQTMEDQLALVELLNVAMGGVDQRAGQDDS